MVAEFKKDDGSWDKLCLNFPSYIICRFKEQRMKSKQSKNMKTIS